MIQPKSISRLCALLLIYCLSTGVSNAQNEEISKPGENNSRSYLTMNLLSSVSPTAPRWRIGYIKNLDNRWKVGVDVGYANPGLIYYDLGDNYELWEIRPEFYYFLNTQRKTRKYLSAELFYINHTDVFSDYHYFPVEGGSIGYDQANFKRQKYGVHLKFGFLFHSRKRIGFNLYGGLGLRIRNNSLSKIINPAIVDLGPEGGDMFGLDSYRNVEGIHIAPNLALGVKLYYRLNN